MRTRVWGAVGTVWVLAACGVASDAGFVADFPVDRSALSATGRNPYFVLEPGYQLSYAGDRAQLVITVLDATESVDGVTTRVVEERETEGGTPTEVSRNYFAIDARTNDVYYFGEDVDEYSGGRVAGHGGSWRSGADGARFGLIMPGRPQPGFKHYQEQASGVAQDRAEIVSTTASAQVPAGSFADVLEVRETSPLEPTVTEYKFYAPGIGLVREGELALTRYGPVR